MRERSKNQEASGSVSFASWPTNDEAPIGAPRPEAQQDWLETCQRVSVLQCPLLLSIAAAMEFVLANKAPNLGLT